MTEQTDDELMQRLLNLNRGEVLEAALALGDRLEVEEASGEQADEFVVEVEADPYEALEDVEQLARAALIAAALDPRRNEALREVVDRVGQKAFIFGGAEIVVVGVIAIGILQTALAKGRTSEEETIEYSLDDRGNPRILHKRKRVFGLSPRLGRLLSSILPGAGG